MNKQTFILGDQDLLAWGTGFTLRGLVRGVSASS